MPACRKPLELRVMHVKSPPFQTMKLSVFEFCPVATVPSQDSLYAGRKAQTNCWEPLLQVMQSCPWALLDDFACDGCVAPPHGFRPARAAGKGGWECTKDWG